MDIYKLPDITKSTCLETYQVGEFLFMEFKDIPRKMVINYHFALVVFRIKTKEPVLCITSETTTKEFVEKLRPITEKHFGADVTEQISTNDSPFLCVIDADDVRTNKGASEAWRNQTLFFSEAKTLALEILDIKTSEELPAARTVEAKSDDDFFIKLLNNWYFVVFVLMALAYCSYHPRETQEQKNFMLGCLSRHSKDFCDRLWERKQEQAP